MIKYYVEIWERKLDNKCNHFDSNRFVSAHFSSSSSSNFWFLTAFFYIFFFFLFSKSTTETLVHIIISLSSTWFKLRFQFLSLQTLWNSTSSILQSNIIPRSNCRWFAPQPRQSHMIKSLLHVLSTFCPRFHIYQHP